ncbi:MAG: hypothetical protein ACFCVG_03985 [Kineosporiaceae bacterium]
MAATRTAQLGEGMGHVAHEPLRGRVPARELPVPLEDGQPWTARLLRRRPARRSA